MNNLIVKAELSNLESVNMFVESKLEEHGCGAKIVLQIALVVEELFANVANYAYKDRADSENNYVDINVEFAESESGAKSVKITFTDEGVPYNPLLKPDPDITLSAEERQIGGLGIFMVKKYVDDIYYEHSNGKNILTVVKNF